MMTGHEISWAAARAGVALEPVQDGEVHREILDDRMGRADAQHQMVEDQVTARALDA